MGELGGPIVSLVLMLTQSFASDGPTKTPPVVLFWVTLGFAILRRIALAWLSRAYCKIKAADLSTTLRDIDRIISWGFWEQAERAWLLSTMFFSLWYGYLFMLLAFSKTTEIDGIVANMLAFQFCCLLKDALESVKGPEDDSCDNHMKELCSLYKTKRIKLQQYQEAVKANENAPETCCVCLDDFSDKDEVVQLPCGHIFHPLCSHTWISRHRTCPLRCDIGIATEPEKADTGALRETAHTSDAPSQNDVEVGLVGRSGS